MKILIARILTTVFLIFIIILCANRYLNWGIALDKVLPFIIYSAASIIILVKNIISSDVKKIINPYSVYSIFILLLGYSFIPLSEKSKNLDFWPSIIILFTIFFFLTGIYIGKNLKIRIKINLIKPDIKKISLDLIIYTSILVFVLECIKMKSIPILNIFNTDIYSMTNKNAIPILHYFISLLYIMPIWLQIIYKKNMITKKKRNIFTIISSFILVNYLSRQMWILLIICFVLYYAFYHTITRKKIIFISIFAVGLFIAVGSIRLLTLIKDDRSQIEYLKDFSDIKYDANLVEVYLGLYSSINFTTFNTFVNNSDKENYKAYGLYSLNPLITITGLNLVINDMKIKDNYNSFSSLATYAIEPYLDFGIIGVIILNLIYGILVGYSYRQYSMNRERWIVPWSIMVFCVVMSTFTNFFNTFFVWFSFIVNFIILPKNINEYKNE